MFGPNAATLFESKSMFHHRGPEYRTLLAATRTRFRTVFGIPEADDVLFFTGSGTVANEAVLSSAKQHWYVHNQEREFAERLRLLAQAHGKYDVLGKNVAWVGYETAISQPVEPPPSRGGLTFADMVSAFPFYAPPENADIWSTVTSKQIGALPVMSVVVVKASAWTHLESTARYSYMNLARYREAQSRDESPHTPSIPLLDDLCACLVSFDVEKQRQKIMERRRRLSALFSAAAVVGEGPVFTVRDHEMPMEIAKKFSLYKSHGGYQFFLWSGSDADYEAVYSALEARL